MARPVKPRRPYHSPLRVQQARSTRQSILDAAQALFVELGFVATTVDAIAARANVSVETVFGAFGSKRGLLVELVDSTIAGGPDAPPVMEQGWVDALRAAPDARRRLRILARNGRRILERRSALDEVVHGAAAADAGIAGLWRRLRTERLAGQGALLRLALTEADLPHGITMDAAIDTLYALGSPEMYGLLVLDRGWSGDRFERWYGDSLERLLLRGA